MSQVGEAVIVADMETRATLRILLAVTHPSIRRSLRAILEDHHRWRIVAELDDSVEAVRQAEALKPDVSIIDITTSTPPLEAVRRTVRRFPETRILALGSHAGATYVSPVREAGAVWLCADRVRRGHAGRRGRSAA